MAKTGQHRASDASPTEVPADTKKARHVSMPRFK
jgi:hypothetical protein